MVKFSGLFGGEDERSQMNDVVALVRRYVLQETLDPLKKLLHRFAYWIGGALCLGIGSAFLLLAVLRALETETGSAFAGNWSFAPYGLTAVVGFSVIGLVAFAGFRHRAAHRDR